jgi:hypothetical protein
MNTHDSPWATFAAAWRFLIAERRAFLRTVSPGAAMVGLATLAIHALAGPWPTSPIAATFAVLLFQIYFAERWMHHALRAAQSALFGRSGIGGDPDEIHYAAFFRYGLLLALCFAVAVGPLGVVMNLSLAGGVWGIGPDVAGLGTFLLGAAVIGPPFLLLIGRFLLVFPARAVDIPLTLGQAWSLSAGIGRELFATQVLSAAAGMVLFTLSLAVPWLFLALFPGQGLAAAALQAAAVAALTAVYIAVAGYCLAVLFGRQWSAAGPLGLPVKGGPGTRATSSRSG